MAEPKKASWQPLGPNAMLRCYLQSWASKPIGMEYIRFSSFILRTGYVFTTQE